MKREDHVFIGNVPGHKYENTYCPNCGKSVINRYIFDIDKKNLTKDGKCANCNYDLKIKLSKSYGIYTEILKLRFQK